MKWCKDNVYLIFTLVVILICISPCQSQENTRQINFAGRWAYLQDSQGYIWYATATGKVGRYLYSDPYSVNELLDELPVCSQVNFIREDSKGIIWIGKSCGLFRFDPQKIAIERLSDTLNTLTGSKSHWFLSWFDDEKENVFIAGSALFSYSNKTKRYKLHLFDSLSHPLRFNIFKGINHTIWFSEYDSTAQLLNRQYDPSTGKVLKQYKIPTRKLGIEAFLGGSVKTVPVGKERDETYLILIGQQILKFEAKTGLATKVSLPETYGVIHELENVNNEILVGTSKGYLCKYNPMTDSTTMIWKSPDNESVDLIFPARYSYSAFAITENTIFPYKSGGPLFKKVFQESDTGTKKNENGNMSVVNGNAYLLAPNGLLPLSEENIKEFIRFSPPLNHTKNLNYDIAPTHDTSRFWMIVRYFPGLKPFLGYMLQLRGSKGELIKSWKSALLDSFLANQFLQGMMTDRKNQVWFYTADSKIGRFNIATEEFSDLSYLSGKHRPARIIFDKKDRIWLGFYNAGLSFYDLENNSVKKFQHHVSDSNSLVSEKVDEIFETSDGKIWIGSQDSGISVLDPESWKFRSITKKHGLPELSISGITQDRNGIIWVTTSHYLCRWQPAEDRFIVFGRQDGIEIEASDYQTVFYHALDGTMYLRHWSGIIECNTGLLKNYKAPLTHVLLTNFLINNKQVGVRNGDSILPKEINFMSHITLAYAQNRFSIQYAAADLYGNVEYAYRLFGFEDDWQNAKTKTEANYTNVPPGDYFFQVKSVNHQGYWTPVKEITISIKAPWYRTWLAYLLYACMIAFAVVGYARFRSRKLRYENIKLEEKVEKRTIELRQSLKELKSTQAQLIQSEKMASLGELTSGIAHEIQNPLNFVNNFSELSNELLAETEERRQEAEENNPEVTELLKDIKNNLEKINHHGKRADAIVKGMLQHSRKGSGETQLTNINALADEYLKLAYHGMRGKDNSFSVSLKTDFDNNAGSIKIIPQDIGRVLMNLYNNAFYAVSTRSRELSALPGTVEAAADSVSDKEKERRESENSKVKTGIVSYQPQITVSTKKKGNQIEITVTDNGNGIPEKIIDKIFQPFFTTKPTGQGTGLGLSLSYDIIKAHGGEINIVNRPGEGVDFVIVLTGHSS